MNYFIVINDVQQGPFTIDELRLRNITPETLVWAEGMPQWVAAWQVDELKPLFSGSGTGQAGATPPPTPPPFNQQGAEAAAFAAGAFAAGQASVQSTPQPQPKRRRSKWPWLLLFFVALFVFMFATNPSKDQHRQHIKEAIAHGYAKAVTSGDENQIDRAMGIIDQVMNTELVDRIFDPMLDYHNYLVFSTTSITTSKGDVTTSYGLFGKVFTVSEEKVAETVSKAIGRSSLRRLGIVSEDEQRDNATDQQSAQKADTVSLSKQIGDAIIDHVSQELKKKVGENTDSSTSSTLDKLVDEVSKFFKGN